MTRFNDVENLLALTAGECGDLVAGLGSGYASYRAMFEQDGIDGVFLDGLSEEEMGETLREIGVERGLHIKNIFKHFRRLYANSPAAARRPAQRLQTTRAREIPIRQPSPLLDEVDAEDDVFDADQFGPPAGMSNASVASTARMSSGRRTPTRTPSIVSAGSTMITSRSAAARMAVASRVLLPDRPSPWPLPHRPFDSASHGSGDERSRASDTTGSSTDAVFREALERVRTAVETADVRAQCLPYISRPLPRPLSSLYRAHVETADVRAQCLPYLSSLYLGPYLANLVSIVHMAYTPMAI